MFKTDEASCQFAHWRLGNSGLGAEIKCNTYVNVSVLLIKIVSQEMSHLVILRPEIFIPFHQVGSCQ